MILVKKIYTLWVTEETHKSEGLQYDNLSMAHPMVFLAGNINYYTSIRLCLACEMIVSGSWSSKFWH
jgi:hypothetical protein